VCTRRAPFLKSLRFLIVWLLALGVTPALIAQRTLGSERQDVRDFGGDLWAGFTSPTRIRGSDLPLVGAGVAAVALASRADSAIWQWMNGHPDALGMRAVSPIRESFRFPLYELGSGQYILPLSGILYVAGRVSHDVDLRDAGLGCATGHLASLGLRQVAYHVVARERPRETVDPDHINFPGSHEWSWQSFFSGHTANSMACASFLGHRFSLGVFEPVPYLYSAAIGIGRMADGRHWFSDTMTGAIAGWALGREIAQRQIRRADRRSALDTPASASLAPMHPMVRWSITF
jgi:hypothetical protein